MRRYPHAVRTATRLLVVGLIGITLAAFILAVLIPLLDIGEVGVWVVGLSTIATVYWASGYVRLPQ